MWRVTHYGVTDGHSGALTLSASLWNNDELAEYLNFLEIAVGEENCSKIKNLVNISVELRLCETSGTSDRPRLGKRRSRG